MATFKDYNTSLLPNKSGLCCIKLAMNDDCAIYMNYIHYHDYMYIALFIKQIKIKDLSGGFYL